MQLSLMAIGQTVTHHIAYTADPRDVADILLHDHRVDRRGDHRRQADQGTRRDAPPPRAAWPRFYDRLSGGAVLDQLIEWR